MKEGREWTCLQAIRLEGRERVDLSTGSQTCRKVESGLVYRQSDLKEGSGLVYWQSDLQEGREWTCVQAVRLARREWTCVLAVRLEGRERVDLSTGSQT